MKKIEEKSCGGIIIENEKVLLIQQNDGFWGFPKGHVEKEETEEETAKREIKEETNLDVEIDIKSRYRIEYITDKGRNKEVVYFIAKKIGGEIKKQEEEIQKIKWVNFQEAMELLSFDNTKQLFKKILEDRKTKKNV